MEDRFKQNLMQVYKLLQDNEYSGFGETQEEFNSLMSDDDNRKAVFDALTKEGYDDLGDFDEFTSKLIAPKVELAPIKTSQGSSIPNVGYELKGRDELTSSIEDAPNPMPKPIYSAEENIPTFTESQLDSLMRDERVTPSYEPKTSPSEEKPSPIDDDIKKSMMRSAETVKQTALDPQRQFQDTLGLQEEYWNSIKPLQEELPVQKLEYDAERGFAPTYLTPEGKKFRGDVADGMAQRDIEKFKSEEAKVKREEDKMSLAQLDMIDSQREIANLIGSDKYSDGSDVFQYKDNVETFQDFGINDFVTMMRMGELDKGVAENSDAINRYWEAKRRYQEEERKSYARKKAQNLKKIAEIKDSWKNRLEETKSDAVSGGLDPYAVGLSKSQQNYSSAIANLEEENKKIDAYLEDKGGLAGFRDAVTDAKIWDDAYQLAEARNLKSIQQKLDKNETLSDDERMLIESLTSRSAIEGDLGKKLSDWYRWGGIGGYSTSFMKDFVLTGGGFQGVAKAGLKVGTKAAAKAGIKNAIGKFAMKATGATIGDVAAASLLANTLQGKKVASDAILRQIGQFVPQYDDDGQIKRDDQGNIMYTTEGGKDAARAIYEAEASAIIENYTELLGEHFGFITTGAKKVAGKIPVMRELTHAISTMPSSKFISKFNNGMRKAGIQDFVGEVMEEEAGIPLNMFFLGEGPKDADEFWKMQKDIVGGMALSIGYMKGVGYTVGGIEKGIRSIAYHKAKSKLQSADDFAYTKIPDWDDIRALIDDTPNEALGDVLQRNVIDREDLSNEAKFAAIDYVNRLAYYRGFNLGNEAAQREGNVSEAEQVVDSAVEEGYNADETQRAEITSTYDNLRSEMSKYIDVDAADEDPIGFLNEISRRPESYSDEVRNNAVAYVNAKARFDGMIQNMSDKIESESEKVGQQVDERTNKDTGMVQQATMRNGMNVYIVGGNVASVDGKIDARNSSETLIVRNENGELQMVSADAIDTIAEPISAEEEKQTATEALAEQMRQDFDATVTPQETEEIPTEESEVEQTLPEEQIASGTEVSFNLDGKRVNGRTQGKIDGDGNVTITYTDENGNTKNAQVNVSEGIYEPFIEIKPEPKQTQQPSVETEALATTEGNELPRDEKGEVIYESIPYEDTLAELSDLPKEVVDKFIDNKIAEAQKALDDVYKRVPEVGLSASEYRAAMDKWGKEQKAANQKLKYWKGVKALSTAPIQEAVEETPIEEVTEEVATEEEKPTAEVEEVAEKVEEEEKPKLSVAEKAGLEKSNVTKPMKEADLIDRLAKRLGVRVVFVDEVDGGKGDAKVEGNTVYFKKGKWSGKKTLKFLIGHEFTHRMQDLSPKEYAAYMEVVKTINPEWFKKRKDYLRDLYKKRKISITEEGLDDEVTADFTGMMLDNYDVFDRVLDALDRKENGKTILGKIKNFIKEIISFLTANNYNAPDITSPLNKALEKLDDLLAAAAESAEKIKLQDKGGVLLAPEAVELKEETGYKTPNERDVSLDKVPRLSVATMPEWEKYMGESEADRLIVASLTQFVNRIAADDAVLSVVPHEKNIKVAHKTGDKGPIRSNVEYVWTFDMDTTCPRTLQYLAFANKIERKIGRQLSQREAVLLIEQMRAYGLTIPCVYCYAENKRQALKQYFLNFMEARHAVLSADTDEEARKFMYGQTDKGLTKPAQKVFKQWRALGKNAYNPNIVMLYNHHKQNTNSLFFYLDEELKSGKISKDTKESALLSKVVAEFGIKDKLAESQLGDMVAEWRWDVVMNKEHKNYTPLDEDDYPFLNENALSVWREMVLYGNSASGAKGVVRYVPYTNELQQISKEDKDYVNGMGGFRMHSTNDFRIEYVVDYFQFFGNLAQENMFVHTYTKSPEFVHIFGNTGARINMSLAAYGGENGTDIIPNSQEGFDWKMAKQLREQYPNVGTMFMAVNDAQLQFALDADWIDMIIPFHSSGLPKEIWYDMRHWQDYHSIENERPYNRDDMAAVLKSEGVKVPSSWNAAKVTEEYLKNHPIKMIYDEKGKRIIPHFYPRETVVGGNVIPSHENNKEKYLALCKEYGVHPRFEGITLKDKNGNDIDITEHPNYMKVVKETSRTDTPQTPVKFNFDEVDKNLGMTPYDYAFKLLEGIAKTDADMSYDKDTFGVVPEFLEQVIGYEKRTGKQRPLNFITRQAREYYNEMNKAAKDAVLEEQELLAGIPYHPRYEYEEEEPTKIDGKLSISEDESALKQAQFDVISESNPMADDYHTGVRSADDILTFEEAMANETFTPDFTKADAEKAIRSGKVKVYSSYPIENGVFVTPSKMEAKNYAGEGDVYEKVAKVNDVAWLDTNEGQYAPTRYSIAEDEDYLSDLHANNGERELDNLDNAISSFTKNENQDSLEDYVRVRLGIDTFLFDNNAPELTLDLPPIKGTTDEEFYGNAAEELRSSGIPSQIKDALKQLIKKNNPKWVDKEMAQKIEQAPIVKEDNATLVGVHNLNDENLRKSLSLGGMANPSVAVIDSETQTHDSFGGISLILPSSAIDGQSTFTEDAWTPMYPTIIYQLSNKNYDKLARVIRGLIKDYSLANSVITDFQQHLQGNRGNGLEYLYLKANGMNPKSVKSKGKIDVYDTFMLAKDRVREKGLEKDFAKWLDEFISEIGAEKVFADGKTPSERIRYRKATLENISKKMNKESMVNAEGWRSLGATRAMMLDEMKTLGEIKRNSWLLDAEEYDFEFDRLQRKWFDIVDEFEVIAEGETRDDATEILQKALSKKSPIAALKRRGYDIYPEFVSELKKFKNDLLDMPSRFFETKFNRPVYINEFASAVVPSDMAEDLKQGLANNGVPMVEYERGNTEDRKRAFDEAIQTEGVRFSIAEDEFAPVIQNEMRSIKDAAIADGTFMKAPNGKKSNLNERQWLQVRTKAFKEWFGDWENNPENASKVLDKNKEPKVVYHGTLAKDLFRFSEDFIGSRYSYDDKGFFFIDRESIAKDYSTSEFDSERVGKVIDAFINLKNPLIVDSKWAIKNGLGRNVFKDNDVIEFWDNYQSLMIDESENNDGVIINDGESEMVVAFKPNQIKSATENVGTFRPTSDDIRYSISEDSKVDTFYSNAERAVEGIGQKKATPEQWLKMIQKAGGLKAGEDKWLGLSDWLNASTEKTLTKDEVLDYIRANEIQMEEVNYTEEGARPHLYRAVYKAYGEEFQDAFDHDEDLENPSVYINDFEKAANIYNAENEEQIELNEDGSLKNYADRQKLLDFAKGKILDVAKTLETGTREINTTRLEYTTRGLDNKKEIVLVVPNVEPFQEDDTIHFGTDTGGKAIAWVRFGETTDAEGNRVLVIDEIQSNRHQEGRKKGYKPTDYKSTKGKLDDAVGNANKKLYDFVGELVSKYNIPYDVERVKMSRGLFTDEEKAQLDGLLKEYDKAKNESDMYSAQFGSGVEAAPFEKNWMELGFKRMLRYAAENGFDKVAWTTGIQQAERYNIGGKVDKIERSREDFDSTDESRHFRIYMRGDDNALLLFTDGEGRVTYAEGLTGIDYKGKPLSDFVGKEVSEQMMALPPYDGIKGADLEYGGEGMKSFYDKMLPTYANKYVKKWGSKVEDVTLPKLREDDQVMHSVEVTPQMRESVMKGQALFRTQPQPVPTTMNSVQTQSAVQNAQRIADNLHLNVTFLDSTEGLEGLEAKSKGWFDPMTGKIVIVLPNNANNRDVQETLLHEGVAHYGLRQLLGDNFNEFLRDVYINATTDIQRAIAQKSIKHGFDIVTATEEYLADLAEDGNFVYAGNFFEKVRRWFNNLLRKVGFNIEVDDNELRYLLWKSYDNLLNPTHSIFNAAEDVLMQQKLGVGNFKPKYRFIGEKGAANLDKAEEATTRLDNLNVAKEMEKANKTAKEIKMATGWERGADKKWRYETMDGGLSDNWREAETLGESLNSPELFSAYPQMRDINVILSDEMDFDEGSFFVERNTITVGARSEEDLFNVLAHEIQHAIQHIEGFAKGGHPSLFKDDAKLNEAVTILNELIELSEDGNTPEESISILKKKIQDDLGEHISDKYYEGEDYSTSDLDALISVVPRVRAGETFEDLFDEYFERLETEKPRTAYEKYLAIAGETEARNVQSRLGMTTEQRRASLAEETEDVARKDQIFLEEALGASPEARYSISEELFEKYPTWLSGQTTETGQHTTQITSTVNTYKKIGEWLKSIGKEGARILDASSGLGKGTEALREMGFDVEDVEPYPSENRTAPTYTNYNDVTDYYDVVISNAVLNVIPEDWRRDVLLSMADKVADGGKLIINVRDAKEMEKQKQKIELDDPSEILVTDKKGNIRAYQKGFTQKELEDYVKSELGEGWEVERANKANSGLSGARAVVATKVGGTPRYSVSEDGEVLDNSIQEYNRLVNMGDKDALFRATKYNFVEAFQDEMLSLKILQGIVSKIYGRPIDDIDNAYMYENQLSSVDMQQIESYVIQHHEPLNKLVDRILKKLGRVDMADLPREGYTRKQYEFTYDKLSKPWTWKVITKNVPFKPTDYMIRNNYLNRYLISKHGLERNRVFMVREYLNKLTEDANALKGDKKKEALEQIESIREDFKRRESELFDDFINGDLTFAEYTKMANELTLSITGESEMVDYSGLTALLSKSDKKNKVSFTDSALKRVEKFESEIPEYKEMLERIGKINEAILLQTNNSGMIDANTLKAMNEMFHYYMPLRGFEEEVAEDVYDYIGSDTASFNKPIRKAKGRKSESDDIIATLGNMMQSAVLQGNRNIVKLKFLNMVRDMPVAVAKEINVWMVKNASGEYEEKFPNIKEGATPEEVEEAINDFDEEMKELKKKGLAKVHKSNIEDIYKFANKKDADQHYVSVFENGDVKRVVIIGNPRAAQAVNGLLKDNTTNAIVLLFKAYNRYYTSMRTSYNPEFMTTNFLRDSMHASLYSLTTEGFIPTAMIVKNAIPISQALIRGVFKNGNNIFGGGRGFREGERFDKNNPNFDLLFHLFITNGGETGYSHMNSVDEWKDMNRKRFARLRGLQKALKGAENSAEYINECVDNVNRFFEDATRFNVFATHMMRGDSIPKSIDAAKNITTNFNRKGSSQTPGLWGALANMYRLFTPFANPVIQSAAWWFNLGKTNPIATSALITSSIVAYPLIRIISDAIATSGDGDGDDDDEEIERKRREHVREYMNNNEYTRQNNFLIKTDSGFVKIPIAPMYRELYGLGDIAYQLYLDDITPREATFKSMAKLLSIFSLEGQIADPEYSFARTIIPDQLGALVDVEQNTTFTGMPLYKEGGEFEPEHLKVYDDTWQWTKDLSQGWNNFMGGTDETIAPYGVGKWTNPASIQHYVEDFGAGPLQFAMKVYDTFNNEDEKTVWSKVPFVGKFYTSPTDRTIMRYDNQRYRKYEQMYKRVEHQAKKNIFNLDFDTENIGIAAIMDVNDKAIRDLRKKRNDAPEEEYQMWQDKINVLVKESVDRVENWRKNGTDESKLIDRYIKKLKIADFAKRLSEKRSFLNEPTIKREDTVGLDVMESSDTFDLLENIKVLNSLERDLKEAEKYGQKDVADTLRKNIGNLRDSIWKDTLFSLKK